MDKENILKHLDNAIEKQVPEIWDEIKIKLRKAEELGYAEEVVKPSNVSDLFKKRTLYKRFSLIASACLLCIFTLTFTPVFASIQELYDKIFSSKHIDDIGVRSAIKLGKNQAIDQTYYDRVNDITVHFDSVMTDDKETKLLLTYRSKTINLKDSYIDIFEGASSINLIVNGAKTKLDCVGWGSKYYDRKENKVAEALSFESIKGYEGQDIRLEIVNLTNGDKEVHTKWPLEFKLNKSAISERETVEINKEFNFENVSYKIKKVEYSSLETRVVVTGSDTKLLTDESGMKYGVMSKLEHQFLHARKIDENGYTVNHKKSGIFLKSAGEKVDPIFSKGEVKGRDDEYVMFFAPVKDRKDCILEVGDDIKIPLTTEKLVGHEVGKKPRDLTMVDKQNDQKMNELQLKVEEYLKNNNYVTPFPPRVEIADKYIYVSITKTEKRDAELEQAMRDLSKPYGEEFEIDIRKSDMTARQQEIRWDNKGIISILADKLMKNKEFKVRGFSYSFHPLPLLIEVRVSVKSTDPKAKKLEERIQHEIDTFIKTDELTKDVRNDPYVVTVIGKDEKKITKNKAPRL